MPRKPTGHPRGRPPGTGKLGQQTRLTVRIPTLLYDRLEAFAAGRHFHRGTPQLAGCVRDALEEYLTRHSNRQTQNATPPVSENIRQTEKRTAPTSEAHAEAGDEKRQPENKAMASQQAGQHKRQTKRHPRPVGQSPQGTRANIRQPRNEHAGAVSKREEARDDKRQTEYDTTKYVLGELCTHGHTYHATGQSLRRLSDRECMDCHAARMRAYRERKRQAQPASRL